VPIDACNGTLSRIILFRYDDDGDGDGDGQAEMETETEMAWGGRDVAGVAVAGVAVAVAGVPQGSWVWGMLTAPFRAFF